MKITLKGYKQIRTMDGIAFSAAILFDGRKVGEVVQGGYGGPNQYHFPKATDFDALIAEAVVAHPETKIEVEDHLIEDLISEMEQQKIRAKNEKKGYPVTVVITMSEYENEILGLRTLAAVESLKTNPKYAGKSVRVVEAK